MNRALKHHEVKLAGIREVKKGVVLHFDEITHYRTALGPVDNVDAEVEVLIRHDGTSSIRRSTWSGDYFRRHDLRPLSPRELSLAQVAFQGVELMERLEHVVGPNHHLPREFSRVPDRRIAAQLQVNRVTDPENRDPMDTSLDSVLRVARGLSKAASFGFPMAADLDTDKLRRILMRLESIKAALESESEPDCDCHTCPRGDECPISTKNSSTH